MFSASMNIHIREATAADAEPIAGLLREVFAETYGPALPDEVLQPYLAREFAIARVAHAITRPRALHLSAEINGTLAGASWLAERPAPPELALAGAAELEKLYVGARWRGQGVANRLLARSIELAREQGWRALWLAVWKRNPRAIAFYRQQGFAPASHMSIFVGHIEFHDLVMLRGLDD
jgi:GNAT superfamily N-acetyltransferase